MKKDIETINKGQEEMKNTISELKNTVEGIKSSLDEAEDRISKLEDEVEKKEQKKVEEGLRELQNNMIHNNIHITGIPEGEEEQGTENLFEKVIMENFPNLMREKVTRSRNHRESQARGTQRGPPKDTS